MTENEFEKNCFEIITMITQEMEKRKFETDDKLAFLEFLSFGINEAILEFKKKYGLYGL